MFSLFAVTSSASRRLILRRDLLFLSFALLASLAPPSVVFAHTAFVRSFRFSVHSPVSAFTCTLTRSTLSIFILLSVLLSFVHCFARGRSPVAHVRVFQRGYSYMDKCCSAHFMTAAHSLTAPRSPSFLSCVSYSLFLCFLCFLISSCFALPELSRACVSHSLFLCSLFIAS